MKKVTTLVLIFLFSFTLFSQDIIINKKSQKIEAKIEEVANDIVKYRKFDNLEGPIYHMSKTEISSIVYENSTVETFNNESARPVAPQITQQQQVQKPKKTREEKLKINRIYSFHIGGGMPLGTLGKKVTMNNAVPENLLLFGYGNEGGATYGFNLGVKFKIPIKKAKGLGVTFSTDCFVNFLQSDVNDFFNDFDKVYKDLLTEILDVIGNQPRVSISDVAFKFNHPKYLNLPILAGFNYCYQFKKPIGLFIDAGVGVNFSYISNYKWQTVFILYDLGPPWVIGQPIVPAESARCKIEILRQYKLVTSFAFQVGLGMMVANRISLGVHFNSFGKTPYKVDWVQRSYVSAEKVSDEIFETETLPYRNNIYQLSLRLGFHF